MPTFIIVKDLFNYIDTRGDGYVDIHEWMQTFKRIEVPIVSDHLMHVVLNPNGEAFSRFENTKKFDDIVRIISKNRKFLLSQFGELKSRKCQIDFNITRKVLGNLLGSSGVRIDTKFWPLLISFADKDGLIDYKYLLDRYKERTQMVDLHPNPNS